MSTPIFRDDTANYLRTGLPSKSLEYIGIIALMWNSLELDYQRLIWQVAGWDESTGPLVTLDMGNVSRANLLLNLLAASRLHDRIKEEAAVVSAIFNETRVARNALVHGIPSEWSHKGRPGVLMGLGARQGGKGIDVRLITVTLFELRDAIDDLTKLSEFIADSTRKISNQKQFETDVNLAEKWTFDEFVFGYRSPAITKDDLSDRLKKLRLRDPPNPQRKAPTKPPRACRR